MRIRTPFVVSQACQFPCKTDHVWSTARMAMRPVVYKAMASADFPGVKKMARFAVSHLVSTGTCTDEIFAAVAYELIARLPKVDLYGRKSITTAWQSTILTTQEIRAYILLLHPYVKDSHLLAPIKWKPLDRVCQRPFLRLKKR